MLLGVFVASGVLAVLDMFAVGCELLGVRRCGRCSGGKWISLVPCPIGHFGCL